MRVSALPIFYLFLFVFGSIAEAAPLKLAGAFRDHAIVQRDKPVPVWGWAEPGAKVAVQFAGQDKTATADAAGKWTVTLDAMPASAKPRELVATVPGLKQERRITDVVVGDVFLLGGQSNMSWQLKTSTGGDEAIKRANYPWLRRFDPGWLCVDAPAADVSAGKWQTCTPETAGSISGVGFFFAEALHAKHDVPIGLMQTDIAGTWGENWVSRAAMEADPAFAYCLDKYKEDLAKLPEEQKRWEIEKAAHEQKVAEAKAAGKKPPEPPNFVKTGPMGPKHSHQPHGLYNGRVAPLMPYALRGIFWYQGEGNSQIKLAEKYHKLLTTLVQSWRAGFAQGDLPFLIVQLPPRGYDSPWSSYPLVREAQLRVSREQPNCGLVVLMDDKEGDIHPKNKQPVGERLALLARKVIHGEDILHSSPVPKRHEIKDGAILVHFDQVGKGLQSREGAPRHFTVCGADKVFHPATAEIIGKDTIRVTSPKVLEPVAVRYAWEPFPKCNLFNSEALPAPAFRTDDYNTGHYLPLEPYLKAQKAKKNK
jgi:sialate O-acetylesterase